MASLWKSQAEELVRDSGIVREGKGVQRPVIADAVAQGLPGNRRQEVERGFQAESVAGPTERDQVVAELNEKRRARRARAGEGQPEELFRSSERVRQAEKE